MGIHNKKKREAKKREKEKAARQQEQFLAKRPLMKEAFPELFDLAGSERQSTPLGQHRVNFLDKALTNKFLELVERSQEQIQLRSIEDLDKLSRQVLRRLLKLRQELKLKDKERSILEFAQLWLAVHPLRLSVQLGRFAFAYDWVVHSLHDEVLEGPEGKQIEVEFRVERLIRFISADNGLDRKLVESTILEWAAGYYYYGRKQNVLEDLGHAILGWLAPWVESKLPMDGAVETALFMLPWVEKRSPIHARHLVHCLEGALHDAHCSRLSRKAIGIALITSAGAMTTTPVEQRAKWVLEHFSDLIKAHERLQLTVASLGNQVNAIEKARELILAAIEEHHTFLDRQAVSRRSWKAMYGRGRLFDIFAPLLLSLLDASRGELAQEFLGSWLGVNEHRRTDPLLFVVINHPLGTLYAREGMVSCPAETGLGLASLTRATNRFLGLTLANVDEPGFELEEPRVVGLVAREHGPSFEEALRSRLELSRLRPFFPAEEGAKGVEEPVKGMIVIPGGSNPIQALMIRELGKTLPWSISLQEPAPDRDIRSVLLWCTGTFYSPVERDAVATVFRQMGAEVEIVDERQMEEQYFRKVYESAQYDVIWVGTHGIYPHYSPHHAGILINSEKLFSLDQLAELRCPSQGRRLLVLNICEGATTAALGGIQEMGIAAVTSSRSQAVISHLWPVGMLTAPAVAICLALGLAEHRNFFKSYVYTLRTLAAGAPALLEMLRQRLGKESEIFQRLERGGLDLSSIADWGSLAFFE